jgi:hypothetical protein
VAFLPYFGKGYTIQTKCKNKQKEGKIIAGDFASKI